MQNGSFLILLQFDASQRYSWECKWLIQKPSVVLTRILQPILVIHEVVDDVFHITGHGLHTLVFSPSARKSFYKGSHAYQLHLDFVNFISKSSKQRCFILKDQNDLASQ